MEKSIILVQTLPLVNTRYGMKVFLSEPGLSCQDLDIGTDRKSFDILQV